jgi:hypothetical protein
VSRLGDQEHKADPGKDNQTVTVMMTTFIDASQVLMMADGPVWSVVACHARAEVERSTTFVVEARLREFEASL